MQVWPVIRALLGRHSAPDRRTRQAIELLNRWLRRGGSRLDSDLDGKIDDPGAAVMDRAWVRIADAVMRAHLGSRLLGVLESVQPKDQAPYGRNGSSFAEGWYGYVDKGLRTLLNPRKVRGRFRLRYGGRGSVKRCRARSSGRCGPPPLSWPSSRPPSRPGGVPTRRSSGSSSSRACCRTRCAG